MRLVFLLGAPRSGTTWLQLLLYQHPEVVTCQETHLFDWYIARTYGAWEREGRHPDVRGVGLRGQITEKCFVSSLAGFANNLIGAVASAKPEANVLLEKTPDHITHWRLIHRLFPNARLLHLIRDPRAVVASLKRVGTSWGRDWAPRSTVDGARIWAKAVYQRGEMRQMLGDLYTEIRYEDLRDDPVNQVLALYRWMGITSDAAAATAAVAACEAAKLQAGTSEAMVPWDLATEPPEFYRETSPDRWRKELGPRDIRIIEFINSRNMDELGYRRDTRDSLSKPAELFLRDGIDATVSRLARMTKRRIPWLLRIAERAVRD